jgi:anti-sigma-K factor RskA
MKNRKDNACPMQKGDTELLLSYCAGSLEAGQVAELERHVGVCPECRNWVEQQQTVWQALEAWEEEPISADFEASLFARIAREEKRSVWQRWREGWRRLRPGGLDWRVAAPAGAVALLLVVGLAVRNPFRWEQAETMVKLEAREIEQAERALEDLEMLRQLEPPEEETRL